MRVLLEKYISSYMGAWRKMALVHVHNAGQLCKLVNVLRSSVLSTGYSI